MMLATSTGARSLEFSDAIVRATAFHAARMAEITAMVLQELGIVPNVSDLRLPADFLLELGAVAQIGVWDLQGFHRQLNVDLPTQAEAATSLAERGRHAPKSFFPGGSAAGWLGSER